MEHKLASLQDSIKIIEGSPGAIDKDKPKKPAVLDAATRHQLMFEEEAKRRQTRNFAKQKMQEQTDIRRRKDVRAELFRARLQQQFEGDGSVYKRMEKLVQDMKARKMEELMSKAERRKEALMKQLAMANNTPNPHTGGYFYQKALEEYQASIEQPENERRLEHLTKKKAEYKPLNHAEIELHAKKHDVMLAELKQRKDRMRNELQLDSEVEQMAGVHVSRLAKEVLERDQAAKAAKDQADQRKRQLANKRLQYGELVKEMYAPTIDPDKQSEMEEMKYHSEPQRVRLKKDHSMDAGAAAVYQSPQPRGRAKTKQPVQEPTSPHASKSQDYLALRRQSREVIDFARANAELDPSRYQSLIESHPDEKDVRQVTDQMEKNARRQEVKLLAASPTNLQAIQLNGSVNDVIISSIRAKLALLSASVQ